MIRRYFVYFSFALLFALSQHAAVTHEISHIADVQHSSQKQDKTTHSGFCEKCMSYGELAHSIGSSTFNITLSELTFGLNHTHPTHHSDPFLTAYNARAPPQNS